MLIVPRVGDSSWRPGAAGGPPQALLVGRQRLFLAAIASLLSSPPLSAEIRVVTRTDAALEVMREFTPDLVLCEVRGVPLSGPEFVSMLGERSAPAKVLLLADAADEEMLISAIHSGATGFFTKECPSDEFLEGVRAVLAGHFVVAQSLVRRALGVVVNRDELSMRHPLGSLSASERGILAMVGQAQSIATIAVARGTSPKTVRNHLSNIYRKLGARNRTEAVLCAARLGLVDPDATGRN